MIFDDASSLTETGPSCTASEKRSVRAYQIELGAALVAYLVTLWISIATVDRTVGILKIADALLPMIGIVAITAALVRFALRLDELQRQSFTMSFAIAAIACAVLTMALGFLENAGLPRIGLGWVWPMIMLVFGVSYPFVRRRYR